MEWLFGICGLIPIALYGLGVLVTVVLLIKVLRDRLNNAEDDYYDKNVKQ